MNEFQNVVATSLLLLQMLQATVLRVLHQCYISCPLFCSDSYTHTLRIVLHHLDLSSALLAPRVGCTMDCPSVGKSELRYASSVSAKTPIFYIQLMVAINTIYCQALHCRACDLSVGPLIYFAASCHGDYWNALRTILEWNKRKSWTTVFCSYDKIRYLLKWMSP